MKTTKPSSGRLLMSFTVVLSASYKSKELQELPLFFFLKLGFWFYCWFSCCFRPQKISSSATRSIEFTKVSMVVMALVMMLLLWSVIWGVVCIFLGWWFLFLRFSIVLFLTCFVFFLSYLLFYSFSGILRRTQIIHENVEIFIRFGCCYLCFIPKFTISDNIFIEQKKKMKGYEVPRWWRLRWKEYSLSFFLVGSQLLSDNPSWFLSVFFFSFLCPCIFFSPLANFENVQDKNNCLW